MAEKVEVPVQPADNTAVFAKEPVQPVKKEVAMPGPDAFDAEGGSNRIDNPREAVDLSEYVPVNSADVLASMPNNSDRDEWLRSNGWVLDVSGSGKWYNPDTNEVIDNIEVKTLRSNPTADYLDRFIQKRKY